MFCEHSKSKVSHYLSCEAEEPLGFNHLLQHVALDASSAVILVYHSVLQVDVVYSETHMVLLPINDGDGVEFVHHFYNRRITQKAEFSMFFITQAKRYEFINFGMLFSDVASIDFIITFSNKGGLRPPSQSIIQK